MSSAVGNSTFLSMNLDKWSVAQGKWQCTEVLRAGVDLEDLLRLNCLSLTVRSTKFADPQQGAVVNKSVKSTLARSICSIC